MGKSYRTTDSSSTSSASYIEQGYTSFGKFCYSFSFQILVVTVNSFSVRANFIARTKSCYVKSFICLVHKGWSHGT